MVAIVVPIPAPPQFGEEDGNGKPLTGYADPSLTPLTLNAFKQRQLKGKVWIEVCEAEFAIIGDPDKLDGELGEQFDEGYEHWEAKHYREAALAWKPVVDALLTRTHRVSEAEVRSIVYGPPLVEDEPDYSRPVLGHQRRYNLTPEQRASRRAHAAENRANKQLRDTKLREQMKGTRGASGNQKGGKGKKKGK